VDVVIGVRGPIAPPDMCNGLVVPIVAFDQIYSFDRDSLVASIPRPESIPPEQEESFRSAAGELFDRIMLAADNAGATDGDRALNYLTVRYPPIYASAADAFGRNASLTGVTVHPSPLSGTRNIVDVIFSYTNRNTDVTEKFFVRVDVTRNSHSWSRDCHLTTIIERKHSLRKERHEMNNKLKNMPGFTAEASLYETSGNYRKGQTFASVKGSVQLASCYSDCFHDCLINESNPILCRSLCQQDCLVGPPVTCGSCIGVRSCSDGTTQNCSCS